MQAGAYGDDKLKVKLKLPAAIKEAACCIPAAGASMSPSQQNEGNRPLQCAAVSSTPLVSLLLPSGSCCTVSISNILCGFASHVAVIGRSPSQLEVTSMI